VKLAEGAGWATVKIYAVPGWPDRFFFSPFGDVLEVEFKAKRGRARVKQTIIINWLLVNEHNVYLVRDEEAFKDLLSETLDASPVPGSSRAASAR
jgi:hypothetical protein